MKNLLLSLLLTIFFAQLSWGQSVLDKELSFDKSLYEVSDLLSSIREQGIKLAYSSDVLPEKEIQLKSNPTTLRRVLNLLNSQANIQYMLSEELVILSFQEKQFTLSGSIKDRETGEALIGATIIVSEKMTGTTTNSYGFYSLTLSSGTYTIQFNYVGFEQITKTITLDKNRQEIISLAPQVSELDEVTVTSLNPVFNVDNMIPGLTPISIGDEWPIPYFLGEQDIFQNSLTLPGIRSIGEDATGLNIRGGDIDQNLILLDEAPIYNPNHFYGLISVFNPEVVNSVEIMKGHIPAQYGGRASSVINIIQREGNNQEFHASGGLGLVSGRLTVEGPIKQGESSYLVSARRSLLNFSIEDFLNASLDDSRTSFQDLNAKVNWSIDSKNRLFLSAYYGRDRNRAGFNAIRKWGNRSFSLRWNKIFNPRLFSNFTGIVSEYNYQIQDPQEVGSFIGKSLIRDISFKADFGYIINPRNSVDFGLQNTFHKLKPGERQPFNENASSIPVELDNEDALETAFYMSHSSQVSSNLSFQYGLRWSLLQNFGPGDIYNYQPGIPMTDETITDTLSIGSGKVFNRWLGWEPRLALNYKLTSRQSIKASYSKSYQFIHLISNTVSPSPTDIWKLSDRSIEPTISAHYSLGYYTNSNSDFWEFSLELYYKKINNVIEFKDGADLLFNENLETELLAGIGLAYGLEVFIKKNTGKMRGWLSYTLSRSEQQFQNEFSSLEINEGKFFAADFDKLHDVTLTGIYQISPRVSASGTFNYNSGRPLTLPRGKFVFDGKIVPHFEDRNQNRLPDYHRMDISLKIDGRATRKSGAPRQNRDSWVFTIYNVYARRNIYSFFFRESETDPGQTEAIPYSIFRTAIPSVTYNFRF